MSDGTAAPTQTPAPTPRPTEVATPTATPAPDGTASPTPTQAPAVVLATERDALAALYRATDGANWENNRDWLSQEPITKWYGVWTDAAGRVTALWLSNNQLRGELPPELGSLAELKQLRLKDNQLTGPIPAELGRLANLAELLLNRNELSGAIPAELGLLSNLEVLHVHVNQLSGEIPSELGNLSNLKKMWLAGNALTGEIPPELGSLSSLEELHLNKNQLTGPIPSELGQLSNLASLTLSDNQLSGAIPPELGSLGNLWALWLFNNQLTGTIPPELGNLSNLASLLLFENQLSGAIPPDLGKLVNLQLLNLSKNLLEGAIPPELGRLSKLRSLTLSDNRLSGAIPSELGGLADLSWLILGGGNRFTGCIPEEWEGLQPSDALHLGLPICGKPPPAPSVPIVLKVKIVHVGSTEVIIPTGPLSDWRALAELYHKTDGTNWANRRNWLSEAPLRDWHGVTTDGDGRVTELRLDGNQLRGAIPPELRHLSSLVHLSLRDNQLEGLIPSALGNLANLRSLALGGGNRFSGCIPESVSAVESSDLDELGLPVCAAADSATAEASTPASDRAALVALYHATDGANWRRSGNWLSQAPLGEWHGVETDSSGRVTGLSLGDNRLNGAIPSELGRLAALDQLYLDQNQLTGEIPPDLAKLSNLAVLNLNSNQLSGAIPSVLVSLTNLQVLDLGFNRLAGQIPAALERIAYLKALRLAGNQFTGCIPAGLRDVENHDLAETRLSLCGTGERLESPAPEARATPESVEQTAVSRTGMPTVGATQLADDGLEVTLVSVQRFEQLTQAQGSPFRPKNGLYLVVTIAFTNTNDSGNIVVSKANIVLIEPSGNEIAVDSPGVNALLGMASQETEGRPLFLVEAVPGGGTATVAVVFDIDPGLVDLEIDIEGFRFQVPNP